MSNNTSTGIDTAIKIGLIALLTLWCFQIAAPFISPIVWAGIIAIAVYPIFKWLKRKTGLSNGLTATIITLAMLVILITPTVMLTNALVDNIQSLSTHIQNDQIKIPAPSNSVAEWPLVGKKLHAFWQQLSVDPKAALGQYNSQITAVTKWLFSAVTGLGLNILIFIFSIIIAGVFIASADASKRAMDMIFTRVAGDQGSELSQLSHATVQGVVRGVLGIAFIQAVLSGLGFMAIGIPGAGVLAVICLVLAIVQIDILIILIPLSIYAFKNPDIGTSAAMAFLVWNIFVGLLNNVLKPILLAKGVGAPMAIIFIGAIGGMMLSGIIGLFVGAVVMVMGYTLFMAWLEQTDSIKE